MKTIFLTALIFASTLNFVRAETNEESKLIGVLLSNASPNEKEDACRRLKMIGTSAAVPALTTLLADEHLYQSACDVLQTLPGSEATDALLQALAKSRGDAQLGVIHTLGERRDARAIAALSPLLRDSNSQTAQWTARAIGNIGGADSAKLLTKALNSALKIVRPAIVDGLLQCAMQFERNGDAAFARKIYSKLDNSRESEPVRCAAYEGLIRTDEKHALELVLKGIRGRDPAHQAAALQLAAHIENPDATRSYCELLPRSSAAVQAALLVALQQRGDVSAASTALEQTRNTNSYVRAAALVAVGELGDASAVPILANAATSSDAAEQAAAQQALVALRRGDVSATLVANLASASPAAQLEIIRALTARAETAAVPPLLGLIETGSAKSRHAACQALSKLAGDKHFETLARLLVTARDSETRDEIRGVFESIADRNEGTDKLNVQPIVAEIAKSGGEMRVELLRVGAFFSDVKLRAAFRESWTNMNPRVRIGAARALCNTRDPELLPDLLQLARSTTETNLHSLALENYARLVSAGDKKFAIHKRMELLRDAFAVAHRPEDKRILLAGLSGAPCSESLELTQQTESDSGVRAEAEIASVQIATALLASDPHLATTTLARSSTNALTEPTRNLARAALKQFDSGWRFAGPYRRGKLKANQLFDVAFPPERPNATNKIVWRIARGTSDLERIGAVDLGDVVNGNHCIVYLKTRLFAPLAQQAVFEIGSDDGIKLWLNRKLVHANNVNRGLTPGEDRVAVSLRAGWNELLAKVTQAEGGCSMMLRAVTTNGAEIAGLKIDPHGGENDADLAKFKTLKLSDKFFAEGAAVADLNRDGKPDVIAGPFWFEGPDFTKRHEYRAAKEFDPHGYSDNFLTYTADFNGDGWPDIFCVPFPGEPGYWYENPGAKEFAWRQHLAYTMVGNESPIMADVNGDGRPDLVFNNEGQIGYATFDSARPDDAWMFHAASPTDQRFQRFTHGIGAGDINGDGRADIIEATGWWEQPAMKNFNPWKFHPFQFAEAASQILVTDVDGDGVNDVICSWHCHHYGLNWFRQVRLGNEINWEKHEILSAAPDLRDDTLRFSQLHSTALADMNGDGLPDVVTGKRHWAHGPHGDVEPSAPAVVYWFELRRDKNGAKFIPHLIHEDSGVGTQVTAADANGDGRPDVVVANKNGIFVHLNQSEARHADGGAR